LRVRAATQGDLDAVTEFRIALLGLEAQVNPFFAKPRTRLPARARRIVQFQLASPSEVTFVAERGDEIVGVLRCAEASGSPLVRPSRYASITSAFVRPERRRHGVLRALLRAAQRWSRERGIDELRLHCAIGNEAANRAWESLGFTVVEVRRRLVLRGE
jgi:ribosomal protein S18 acetylase RimI-like enzyme